MEQLRRNTSKLTDEIFAQALNAAEDAAAEVFKAALRAAAPRGESGDLEKSIVIYEARDRRALFRGTARRRLLVGPGKRKGFYGYFLEYGTGKMAARPWARPACDAVAGEAQAAGQRAFQQYVNDHIARMKA
jgi:HK97 gp10 family phage protein